MTLSGVVSNHKAGETVAIYYRPYPQPNLIQRATILTSDGGTFSFIVAPADPDDLRGAWKGAFSTPTTVQVQPSLSLGRNNGWIVHASAAALVRRPGGADPAPERGHRPVGDAAARCC